MNVVIYEHAKNNYLKRIEGYEEVHNSLWKRIVAENKIKEAVKNPDKIIAEEEDKPQVHIKDNLAVIVGVETDEQGQYKPYTDLEEDNIVVPTVYESSVFVSSAT